MKNKLRYMPQMRLPEFGEKGQQLLGNSTVLVVGAGALGSVVVSYLCGAGVGHIILADFDTIDISNLHRQIFYKEADTGKSKAETLEKQLRELNSEVKIDVVKEFISPTRLKDLCKGVDLIIDAADNPDTTYMIDSYCVENNLPYVTAGVRGWEAQVFSFQPGGIRYSDIVTPGSSDSGVLPCSIEGILGPVAGMAASIQAVEAIKILLGIEGTLKNNFLVIDLLKNDFRRFEIATNKD